ncbi:UDP-glucose dehydrogenase family protein [Paenibacillus oleatilyticus]|uniref:UDP-glucose dehydrogenase family protein n=1 Tax=Paenibacillus oleatilyticus TaxID=2594886 RepID=UPI001C1F651C|nr:UDP-glucose/GDP-mannose dehydrogenase family protein [Paenibacillus oleatilyticus]MBU7320066.1 UDP-glucose/GDP-mannose dehydrogenase family protein [Paenibacillus oleatilyticus]
MRVVCIGAGYVGSVTGAAFAALGYQTTVIDIDQSKVQAINEGKSPIFEPGLDTLTKTYAGVTLNASVEYDAVAEADVVFIGVGTPSRPDGSADLKYIEGAAVNIAKTIKPDGYTVIVNKSTVPVGTAEHVSAIVEEHSGLKSNVHFSVISNPEFLREGYAVEDVFLPDRIVIGTLNERARTIMRELYSKLVDMEQPYEIIRQLGFNPQRESGLPVYFETDTRSAEMIKYASNAFLAVKISYINEVARLCEAMQANVLEVSKGMGLDSRIGNKFLQVSSGWSGSCFPKDTAEFLAASRKHGRELNVVKAAMESNLEMHAYIVEKVKKKLGTLYGKTIGVLGLTFKPNTDDTRHTQASFIIRGMINQGASVKVHDPQGMEMFHIFNPNLAVTYCHAAEEVADQSDAIVLLTHWEDYALLNWSDMGSRMNHKYVLDTRNFLSAGMMTQLGYHYEGIGIGNSQEHRQYRALSEVI